MRVRINPSIHKAARIIEIISVQFTSVIFSVIFHLTRKCAIALKAFYRSKVNHNKLLLFDQVIFLTLNSLTWQVMFVEFRKLAPKTVTFLHGLLRLSHNPSPCNLIIT